MDPVSLQAKIGALTPAQREQLKRTLAARREAVRRQEEAIPRVPEAQDYALSMAQNRLWMQEELSEGKSAAYNVSLAVVLNGELDVEALAVVLRRVVENHAVLRSRIVRRGGEPRQVVSAATEWILAHWTGTPGADGLEEFRLMAEALANRPFDLERELPFRAALRPIGINRYGLALVFHHIACDGRSVSILVEEIERCYLAQRRGQPMPAGTAVRYIDYAAWHRAWLEGAAGAKAKAYWVGQFAELPEPLDLPCDRPRPAVQDFSGAHLSRQLSRGIRERLGQLAQRSGASTFGVLMAAVATFLHRCTGRDDITIGFPSAGRSRPGLDGVVGFFVNTLPLRSRLDTAEPFRAVVERVRDGLLEALEHEGCPFDVLVQSLALERDLSRPPLFQTMIGLTRAQDEALKLPGLSTEVVPLGLRSSKVELTFHFVETPDGLELDLEYATALFSRRRVELLMEYFETMLEAALAAPEGPIGDLGLLPWERLREWAKEANPPRNHYPRDRSIAALFRTEVERNPGAPAVVFRGLSYSYDAIDKLSDAIARQLTDRLGGLRRDEPIALQVERSERMIAALLGILKAGGCYLPLNPGTPPERVRTLLALSGARLRLTEGEPAIAGWEGGDEDLRAWCLRPDLSSARPGVYDGPEAGRRLAYIIFTSGSTGEPKGVLIEQSSVVRLVRSTDFLQLGPSDRVLQTGALAFDASTFEIWAPLLNGGCCCLPDGKEILEIDRFGALIEEMGATTCFLTTGLFNQIADHNPEAFRHLRHLLTGGEKVSVPHVNRVLAAAPSLELLHVYGPTENTTFSTWFHVRGPQEHDVPIGRPIAHSSVYILDARGNLQPPGVAGEIYCGGDGVARGYLGRPEATAERFVPDPFSELPGARLYRTGDFGRWDEAGNVEFSGRRDDQVKIRGFRIELGEIELRLRALPGVVQAVVVARPAGGTHELVAYVVGSDGATDSALRAGLLGLLPDYMVPGRFVFLAALPLNASGKVNRKALPAPDPAPAASRSATPERDFQDPRESALAAVWSEILGRPPVDADSHYFNSGGDSIKAIQMTARLRVQGYRLTLRDVFARPRFAELAAAMVVGEREPTMAEPDEGEVQFTPIQYWFLETFLPPYDHFNQATLLESERRLEPDLLREALNRIVARHGMLRCRLERKESAPGWRQIIPRVAAPVGWHEFDWGAESPDARRTEFAAAAADLQGSLSLAEGRLVAAAHFRFQNADRVLLVIHHWAVDGISWRIVVEELEAIYRELAAGSVTPGRATPTSFRAWSKRLGAFAKSDSFAPEARIWEELGRSLPAATETPALPACEQREFVLSEAATKQLLTGAHLAYGTTPQEVLLAAFGQAWSASGGGDAVAITLEGHGRESFPGAADVGGTVGWFTSMWPFLLSGSGAWADRLRTVKDALRAIPGRGLGFGVGRYLRTPAVGTGRLPRVSFNYLGEFSTPAGAFFRAVVGEPTGESVAAHMVSPFDLDVVAEVTGGRLRVSLRFHRSARSAAQRGDLAAAYAAALEEAVGAACSAPPRRSLADFTARLGSLGELDRLLLGCADRGVDAEDILPLTPMQEGMFFHALYDPASPAYSDQVVLELEGPLDPATFESAWQALGRQYPNLRAVFLARDTERPLGIVLRDTELGFSCRACADDAAREALRAADRARGFRLDEGPLLRLLLVPLGKDRHEVILGFHHIVLDGWSAGLIWQRLEKNYREIAAGKPLPSVRGSYFDFLVWLRERDRGGDLAAWARLLENCPAGAAIPTGTPRLGAPAVRTRSVDWELGRERTNLLASTARRLGTTENILFQTLWGVFLGRLTRTTDVVFGTTVSGRVAGIPQVEDIVGLLINTIPVRVRWREETVFQDLVEDQRLQSADGFERLSVSLADIQQAAGASESFVRHALVFENYPEAADGVAADGLWRRRTVAVHDPMHFELGVIVVPKRDGWTCRLVADVARYPDTWLRQLHAVWHEVVDRCLGEPLAIIEVGEISARTGSLRRVSIAATFTAEPLADPLRFWLAGRGDEAQLHFAPFNQVIQQLLDPAGEMLRRRGDLNVLLVRLEDWAGADRTEARAVGESLELNADLLVDGLGRLAQSGAKAKQLVVFCPASPAARGNSMLSEALTTVERRLIRRIEGSFRGGAHVVGSREVAAGDPAVVVDDVAGEESGGIPYTQEFFALLATEVVRRWDALTRPPFKVVGLDADNTLWGGVLGEDGCDGVQLTSGHRRLQEAAKSARAGGLLLALVTKNNPEDIEEVFACRPDFPLQRGDFVAVAAGWQAKSDSLRDLARRLNLSPDSIVFLDDSELECAEVRANLPEVLVLRVPSSPDAIEAFAGHLWPLDAFAASAEDIRRSELYRVESQREQLRHISDGLGDFIRQLRLEVVPAAIDEENIERAAQLTQRTNQFNTSTIRRSAADLRELLRSRGHGGFIAEVKDRFGDYGITGLVLFRDEAVSRVVDTFLLSCRVLGRGVEHEILRRLACEAAAAGLKTIRIAFARTGKNAPAEEFLRSCQGREEASGSATWWVFDVAEAARVDAAHRGSPAAAQAPQAAKPKTETASVSQAAVSHFYQHVAEHLARTDSLLAAMEAARPRSGRRSPADYDAPRTELEVCIARIWAAVLGVDRVGRNDDFFSLGGHSLSSVMMLSRVNRALGTELLLQAVFAAPRLADFAAVAADAGRGDSGRAIAPAPAASDYPLSHAQRRLWLVEELRAGTVSPFLMPALFRLSGRLDQNRLATAFRGLIARHEILRTALVSRDAGPRQRVLPEVGFQIEELAEAKVEEFLSRDFDLAHPPLLRVGLHRQDEQTWILAVVMHHAISDGWSIGIMAGELSTLYRGGDALPPLAIHYKDYAIWQNAQHAGARWRSSAAYWHKLLRELPSAVELPADRVRPSIKQSQGADISVVLPTSVWAGIRGAAKDAGATPFVALMAVMQILVSRLSRNRRFAIGTPSAGRDQPELETQIGFYVNLLTIVADLEPAQSFASLLAGVKSQMAAALSHADYPFDRLVTDLNLPRDLSRSPLFDLLMVYQGSSAGELVLDEVHATGLICRSRTTQYDLTFEFAETEDGLSLRLEYDRGLFEEARVTRFGSQYFELLANAFADPARAIGELEICPSDELALIRAFERGRRFGSYRACTVPGLFAAAAARYPSHPALVDGEITISYAEVDRRSAEIAGTLRAAGVERQELVVVAGDRTVDFVCVLLGVMRAGAVYVPVDLNHPDERLRLVTQVGGIRRAIAIGTAAGRRLAALGLAVLDHSARAGALPPDAGECISDRDLAYVIFTSGSTGLPKGVEIEHGAFATMIESQTAAFTVRPDDRCAWWASCAFDASLSEIFLALGTGATLVIAGEAERGDSTALAAWIENWRVSVITLPPAFLRVCERSGLSGLRVLITAGESADSADLLHYAQRMVAINAYGPTETSVCATVQVVNAEGSYPRGIPIGRPLDVASAYVLDGALRRVPVGVTGELFVGGRIVGRGYRGEAELSVQRFLPDPFAGDPGARMYRTGDLVRWREDGALEFLGREDGQVKLRGFRIELGEVENALRQIPGVAAAAVLMVDRAGTKSLVAYVATQKLDLPAIRSAVAERLPDYMRPAAYGRVDRLPMTVSGKLDRAALPPPDWAEQGALTPPQTSRELLLAGEWRVVLGVERIGCESDFFALGGDSIKVLALAARLRAVGLGLNLRAALLHPELRQQARQLQEIAVSSSREVAGEIPLTPIQHWFLGRHPNAPLHHFNQAIYYRATERLDPVRLQRAVRALWRRHASLRANFHRQADRWRQVVQTSDAPAPEVQWFEAESGVTRTEVAAWVCSLQAGLNLGRGPLVGYGVIREPDCDRVLCFTHHLVSDWVSHRILLEDLSRSYRDAAHGAAELPAVGTELDEWMSAGLRWASDEASRRSLVAAWAAVSRCAPPESNSASAGSYGEVTVLTRQLDAVRTQSLRSCLGKQVQCGLREAILAGLVDAECQLTGVPSVAVQLEGHGRDGWGEVLDVSRTVGWFTNLYPCVLAPSERETPAAAVARTAATLAALPDSGATYGLIREYGAAGASLAVGTSIGFNYLGEFSAPTDSALFEMEGDLPPGAIAGDFPRDHPLDVTAWIFDGKLNLQCAFVGQAPRATHMEKWLDRVLSFLGKVGADVVPPSSVP